CRRPPPGSAGRDHWLPVVWLAWPVHVGGLCPHYLFVGRRGLWKSSGAVSDSNNRAAAESAAQVGPQRRHVRYFSDDCLPYSVGLPGGRREHIAEKFAGCVFLMAVSTTRAFTNY